MTAYVIDMEGNKELRRTCRRISKVMAIDPHLDSFGSSSIRRRGRALIEIKAEEEDDGKREEA